MECICRWNFIKNKKWFCIDKDRTFNPHETRILRSDKSLRAHEALDLRRPRVKPFMQQDLCLTMQLYKTYRYLLQPPPSTFQMTYITSSLNSTDSYNAPPPKLPHPQTQIRPVELLSPCPPPTNPHVFSLWWREKNKKKPPDTPQHSFSHLRKFWVNIFISWRHPLSSKPSTDSPR